MDLTMNYRTNESRIICVLIILLIIIQLGGVIILNSANRNISHSTPLNSLNTGIQAFQHQFQLRYRQLMLATRILATDYDLREAIATKDTSKIGSIIANHGNRIQASAVIVTDTSERILATTLPQTSLPNDGKFHLSLSQDNNQGQTDNGTRIIVSGNDLYQIVATPVESQDIIGHLVMGYSIDNELATNLAKTSGTEVAFISRPTNGNWQFHGNTSSASITEIFREYDNRDQTGSWLSKWGGNSHLMALVPLQSIGSTEIVAVLGKSMSKAMAPFQKFEQNLTYLLLTSILLSILGVISVTRKMVGPINTLAYTDSMTGLGNRTLFNLNIKKMYLASVKGSSSFSILLMDLDRFKAVNDTLGHAVGDLVLKEAAIRIKNAVRRSDTVSRLGGDEFVVLLPDTDREVSAIVSNKIIEALESPFDICDHHIQVGISIGIAIAPDDSGDARALLQKADMAMYQAKQTKSRFAFHSHDYSAEKSDNPSLVEKLHKAFDNNEFELYYQPVMRLDNRQPVGAEALIRWKSPEFGLVPPMEFIPYVKSTDLMQKLTHWTIKKSILECARWKNNQTPLWLSINLCTEDLLNPEFPEHVRALVKETKIDPMLLCFEVSERGLPDQSLSALQAMEEIRDIGIHLAVDDFGTGYSSRTYVYRLPISYLKIDRIFTRDICRDQNDRNITLSTIELAHSLGTSVIAEGIEDQETANLLRKIGCDYAQGYYFCRPLSSQDMHDWLESEAKRHLTLVK